MSLQVDIDKGGTFTDLIAYDSAMAETPMNG